MNTTLISDTYKDTPDYPFVKAIEALEASLTFREVQFGARRYTYIPGPIHLACWALLMQMPGLGFTAERLEQLKTFGASGSVTIFDSPVFNMTPIRTVHTTVNTAGDLAAETIKDLAAASEDQKERLLALTQAFEVELVSRHNALPTIAVHPTTEEIDAAIAREYTASSVVMRLDEIHELKMKLRQALLSRCALRLRRRNVTVYLPDIVNRVDHFLEHLC